MANILDIQTIGRILVMSTDTDPRQGGGTVSPIGSIVMTQDQSGIWTKVGSGNTDYASGINPYGSPKVYFMSSEFDIGSIPEGWVQSNAGSGVTDYTFADPASIGIARVTAGVVNGSRSGLQYSTGINYLLTFLDSIYTKISFRVKYDPLFSTNSASMFGWINTNASTMGVTGNTLCIMYDPANISGYNPGGITNLFLLARSVYGPPAANTTVDLGILPDAANWHNWSILYDNVNSKVMVMYDSSIITTLTNLSNVPGGAIRGSMPIGAGNSLQPTFYASNGPVPPIGGQNMKLMVDKCSVYKIYS